MSIAILGGSFDPLHGGHILLANGTIETFAPCKVILVPTGDSPHKGQADHNARSHRFQMCLLAAGHEGYEVSDYEIAKQTMCYTIDTVRYFSYIFEEEILFLIGCDSLDYLETWQDFPLLAGMCTFVTLGRTPGNQKRLFEIKQKLECGYGAKIHILQKEAFEVSSSQIREMVAAGQNIDHLVPGYIGQYIKENNLYVIRKRRR